MGLNMVKRQKAHTSIMKVIQLDLKIIFYVFYDLDNSNLAPNANISEARKRLVFSGNV